MSPRVSVVVTTHARSEPVRRAVASVLAQTLREIEVIVVLDGPDAGTQAALAAIDDPRLRVHVKESNTGQPSAINAGVALASAEWTALLDDDDEWLPAKLATQLETAQADPRRWPVVGCYFTARSERGDALWPLRAPRAGEPTGDYLFCRNRLAFGEGVLPTSVLFAPTELLRRVPMDDALPKHCDIDWLVRVDALPDTGFAMPARREPLAVWHQQGADRLSRVHDWRYSLRWIAGHRDRLTPRAYAGFLLTWASFSARSQRDLRALPVLLGEALRRGRPGLVELAVYAAVWCLPLGLRARWSDALAGPGGSR